MNIVLRKSLLAFAILFAASPIMAMTGSGENTGNPNDPVRPALLEVQGGTKASLGAQNLGSTVAGGLFSDARHSISAAANTEYAGWFEVLHNDSKQKQRTGVDGFSANAKGFVAGMSGRLNTETVLGLSYSYVHTDVDSDDGKKTQVDTNALTTYGRWTYERFYVDGGLTYGQNRHNLKRQIGSDFSTKANYEGQSFGLNTLAGYVFDINREIIVEPRVAARYSIVKTDGFTEKDDSTSNQTTNDERIEAAVLGAGVRLASEFEVAEGILESEIKIMAYHDFIADTSPGTSTYVLGSHTFVTTGTSPAKDSFELGLGATYRKGDVTVGLGYNRLTKDEFSADTLTAKVRYDF